MKLRRKAFSCIRDWPFNSVFGEADEQRDDTGSDDDTHNASIN